MKFLNKKVIVFVAAVAFMLFAFGPLNPSLWFASTLDTTSDAEADWFSTSYTGEEMVISTHNPNYEGILMYLNNLLISENVDKDVTKLYAKEVLKLRSGNSARAYMKTICRTLEKEDLTRSDYETVAQAVLKIVEDEPTKNTTKIRAYLEEMMLGSFGMKRQLEQARSLCDFVKEAHDYELERGQRISVVPASYIRYMLENGITEPIVGLLQNEELSESMKQLLLEYKDEPDLAPLILKIEGEEDVSLASVEEEEVEVQVEEAEEKEEVEEEVTEQVVEEAHEEERPVSFPVVEDFSMRVQR